MASVQANPGDTVSRDMKTTSGEGEMVKRDAAEAAEMTQPEVQGRMERSVSQSESASPYMDRMEPDGASDPPSGVFQKMESLESLQIQNEAKETAGNITSGATPGTMDQNQNEIANELAGPESDPTHVQQAGHKNPGFETGKFGVPEFLHSCTFDPVLLLYSATEHPPIQRKEKKEQVKPFSTSSLVLLVFPFPGCSSCPFWLRLTVCPSRRFSFFVREIF